MSLSAGLVSVMTCFRLVSPMPCFSLVSPMKCFGSLHANRRLIFFRPLIEEEAVLSVVMAQSKSNRTDLREIRSRL